MTAYETGWEIKTQGGQTGLHTHQGAAPVARVIQIHTTSNVQESLFRAGSKCKNLYMPRTKMAA